MNYALEPVLKHLNRYLLHFFCTRHMAGPKRFERAWEAIAPTVLHFWSNVAATKITRGSTIIYGQETMQSVHMLTADQLSFIVMHELGHVAFDHPRLLKAAIAGGADAGLVRHEFEFAADAFALGLWRSALVTRENPTPAAQVESAKRSSDGVATDAPHEDWSRLEGIYLLFTYMDFVQRAGELLRERLSEHIPLRERMDTHPRAAVRLDRLKPANFREGPRINPIAHYARTFFDSVFDYASGLNDEQLLASIPP